MTLRCADCNGEARMIRVMRNYLRLGHVHQPLTLHPVRLATQPSQGRASMSVVPPAPTPRVPVSAGRRST